MTVHDCGSDGTADADPDAGTCQIQGHSNDQRQQTSNPIILHCITQVQRY